MITPNAIVLGDCLEVMREIETGSIDLVLADVPYGTTACGWDAIIPLDAMWSAFSRILSTNGAVVMTASQPLTSALVMSNPSWFKHEWIWKKNAGSNFGAVKFQPMKEHESVVVFGRGKIVYRPQMQERAESGKKMIRTGVKSKPSAGDDVYSGLNQGYDNSRNDPDFRYPSSVQSFNRQRGLHPTQKPVDLFRYLVRTYTNDGAVVCDPCVGSGTSIVAAKAEQRRYIAIEKDPRYFTIASQRT